VFVIIIIIIIIILIIIILIILIIVIIAIVILLLLLIIIYYYLLLFIIIIYLINQSIKTIMNTAAVIPLSKLVGVMSKPPLSRNAFHYSITIQMLSFFLSLTDL